MDTQRALRQVEESALGERILRLFHAPRRAFEAVADGGSWADWVVPVALVAGFWSAHNLACLAIVAPEPPSGLPGWEQLTEAQREMAAKGLQVWRSHGWFSMPFATAFSSLALAALALLGVARWILRAEANLRQMLALKAYASLVEIPQWILLTPLVRAGHAHASPLSFSAAALLPAEAMGGTFGRFLSGLNLFDLWQMWLVGLGLAVMTGTRPRHATAVVLTLWLAWLALGSLLPALAPEAPPAA